MDRTPADFSREFAGYMADAAAEYVEVVDAACADPDNAMLAEDMDEFRRHLVSAIYEWRKREERAARPHGLKSASGTLNTNGESKDG